MKSKFSKQASRVTQLGLLVVALFGFSQAAHATLAAEHVIQNTVSVDYDDAGGTFVETLTASVGITVNLVEAAPDVAVTTTDILDPVSTNSSVTLTYDVTSNANGKDTYSFAQNGVIPILAGATTGASIASASSGIELGGTSAASTIAAGGFPEGAEPGVAVTVPMDGAIGGGLSGFTAFDVIVFDASVGGDVVCVVDSIAEVTIGGGPAIENETGTITISGCTNSSGGALAGTEALALGDQIGERKEFSVVVDTGTDTGDLDVNYVIQSDTDNTEETAITEVTITIVAANLDVVKFVRNTDPTKNPACDDTAPFKCLIIEAGGTDTEYYAEDVTADPGDTLEYAILLYNVAGELSDIQGSDPMVLFTTYVADSPRLIPQATAEALAGGANCLGTNDSCYVDDGSGGAPTTISITVDADEASADEFAYFNTSLPTDTLQFSAGYGASVSTAPTSETDGNGGSLDTSTGTTNNVSVFIFQVTVDS